MTIRTPYGAIAHEIATKAAGKRPASNAVLWIFLALAAVALVAWPVVRMVAS